MKPPRIGWLGTAVVTALLFATSCGASSPETTADADASVEAGSTPASTATESADDPLSTLAEVSPNLVDLEELLTVHSPPSQQVFDATGGEVVLADGATVRVPEGVFDEPVEITSVVLDVRYDRYLEYPPEARIYQISTETDVSLSEPVVLEIPGASDEVQVFGLDDGVWVEETLASAAPTRIEIGHFSVVQHLVMHRPPYDMALGNRMAAECRKLGDKWPCLAELDKCILASLEARTNQEDCFISVQRTFGFDAISSTEATRGVFSWTFLSGEEFGATQTIVNPIKLRNHDWDTRFPFPAGPGRETPTPTTSVADDPNPPDTGTTTAEAGDSEGATDDEVFRPEQADPDFNPAATSTTVVSTAVDIEADDGDPIAVTDSEETTTTRPTTTTTTTTTATATTTTAAPTTTTTVTAVQPYAHGQGGQTLCPEYAMAGQMTRAFIIRDSATGNELTDYDGASATLSLAGTQGTTASATATVSGARVTFTWTMSPPMATSERLVPTLVVGGTQMNAGGSIGFAQGNCTYP